MAHSHAPKTYRRIEEVLGPQTIRKLFAGFFALERQHDVVPGTFRVLDRMDALLERNYEDRLGLRIWFYRLLDRVRLVRLIKHVGVGVAVFRRDALAQFFHVKGIFGG